MITASKRSCRGGGRQRLARTRTLTPTLCRKPVENLQSAVKPFLDAQGKRAAATAASGADADADADAAGTPAASALRRKPPAARRTPAPAARTAEKKRPANQPEPYTVPDGFDAASALVECELSDSTAAKRTVPWAFLQRWLTLRDEVRQKIRIFSLPTHSPWLAGCFRSERLR